jgi:hypothetical protein
MAVKKAYVSDLSPIFIAFLYVRSPLSVEAPNMVLTEGSSTVLINFQIIAQPIQLNINELKNETIIVAIRLLFLPILFLV